MIELTIDSDQTVIIPTEDAHLEGILNIPNDAIGVVIFAHGSGSSRLSPRNQLVARILQKAKIATLLFDLLTLEQERRDDRTMQFRFDIPFLARRLLGATNWVLQIPALQKLPIGYFGASTGGGAALLAASRERDIVKAVVSRGGRPDMAGPALANVKAATLLIVGSNDEAVIKLNQLAYEQLHCIKEITIVKDATHLFEEPGKLQEVAFLANQWFTKHLK